MIALGQFVDWLSNTPASQTIQNSAWIVPATQSVHILALSVVLFLMVVLDLQVMGVLARPGRATFARGPMPWLWAGLGILAATGLVLIVGEPRRELFSWPFRIKMALILIAVLLTLVLVRAGAGPEPTPSTRLTAGVVLACWALIVVCGRWIAYINFGPDDAA